MAAVTVSFTAATDNTDVAFQGSRPSKHDAILLGMAVYNAPTVAAEDELINEHGPILVRRSLRAFANYAKRNGQPEVAEAAEAIREDIVITRGAEDESDEDVAV